MVGGARRRSRGGRNASGPRVRRVRARGSRKLEDGGDTGKLDGGSSKKMDARIVQIEGRHSQIEGEGGCILVVPDSEDEDAGDMVPDAVVAAGGAPGMEVAADGAPGMDLAPEVQERLKVVLAGIDPLYHDIFISMYKVMVPVFFKSN